MTRTLVAVVAAALALAACGDSENTADRAAGGSSGATTSTEAAKLTSAEDVVHALRNAGLPLGEVEGYNATTDPNNQLGRPNGYTAKSQLSRHPFRAHSHQ